MTAREAREKTYLAKREQAEKVKQAELQAEKERQAKLEFERQYWENEGWKEIMSEISEAASRGCHEVAYTNKIHAPDSVISKLESVGFVVRRVTAPSVESYVNCGEQGLRSVHLPALKISW